MKCLRSEYARQGQGEGIDKVGWEENQKISGLQKAMQLETERPGNRTRVL